MAALRLLRRRGVSRVSRASSRVSRASSRFSHEPLVRRRLFEVQLASSPRVSAASLLASWRASPASTLFSPLSALRASAPSRASLASSPLPSSTRPLAPAPFSASRSFASSASANSERLPRREARRVRGNRMHASAVVAAFQEGARQGSMRALLSRMSRTDVHTLRDAELAACLCAVADCVARAKRRPAQEDGSGSTPRGRLERDPAPEAEMLRAHTFWHRCIGKVLKGDLILKARLSVLADMLDALNRADLTLFQPVPLLARPASSPASSSTSSAASLSDSPAVCASAESPAASGKPVWIPHRFYFRLLERLEQELAEPRDSEATGSEAEPVERHPDACAPAETREEARSDAHASSCTSSGKAAAAEDAELQTGNELDEAPLRAAEKLRTRGKDVASLLRIAHAIAARQRSALAALDALEQRLESRAAAERGTEGDAVAALQGKKVRSAPQSAQEKPSPDERCRDDNDSLQQLCQARFFFLFFFERLAQALLPPLLDSLSLPSLSSSSPSLVGVSAAPALFSAAAAADSARAESRAEGTNPPGEEGDAATEARPLAAAFPHAIEKKNDGSTADAAASGRSEGAQPARQNAHAKERKRDNTSSFHFETQHVTPLLLAFASSLRCAKRDEKEKAVTRWIFSVSSPSSVCPSPATSRPPQVSSSACAAAEPPPSRVDLKLRASRRRSERCSPPVSLSFLLVPAPCPFSSPSSVSVSSLPPASGSSLRSAPSADLSARLPSPVASAADSLVSSCGHAAAEEADAKETRKLSYRAMRKAFVAVPRSFADCFPPTERTTQEGNAAASAAAVKRGSTYARFPHLNAVVSLLASCLLPHVKSLDPAAALGVHIQLSRSQYDVEAARATLERGGFFSKSAGRRPEVFPLETPLQTLLLASCHDVGCRLLLRLVEQPAGLLRELPGRDIPSFMLSVSQFMPQLNAALPIVSTPPSSPNLSSSSDFSSSTSSTPLPSSLPSRLHCDTLIPPASLQRSPTSPHTSRRPPEQPAPPSCLPSSGVSSRAGATSRPPLARTVASLLPVLARRLAFEQLQATGAGAHRRYAARPVLSPAASCDALTALADAQCGGDAETRRACLVIFHAALEGLWRPLARKKRERLFAHEQGISAERCQAAAAEGEQTDCGEQPSRFSALDGVSLRLEGERLITLSRLVNAALKLGLLDVFTRSRGRLGACRKTDERTRASHEDSSRRPRREVGDGQSAKQAAETLVPPHTQWRRPEKLEEDALATEEEVDVLRKLLAANLAALSSRQLQYLSLSLLCCPAFVLSAPLDYARPAKRSASRASGVLLAVSTAPVAFQCLAEALRRFTRDKPVDADFSARSRRKREEEWAGRQLQTSLIAATLGLCAPLVEGPAAPSTGSLPAAEAAASQSGGQREPVSAARGPAAREDSLLRLLPLESLRTARRLAHAMAQPQRQHAKGTRVSALQEEVFGVLLSCTLRTEGFAVRGNGEHVPSEGSSDLPQHRSTGSPGSDNQLAEEGWSKSRESGLPWLRVSEVEAVVGPYTVDCILTQHNDEDGGTETLGRHELASLDVEQ
ncbi:hypothetical protein BESB_050590 [Besnoitia besnoiti]|uniref:Uncharacterized protein n=1 Tax=Besnoitia besnoiti TaxID=94643 RepID=A0A2A9MM92_BESBE|nr:hypothetical protein BESB_050590 [Besnoitia besnoiti]PFH36867.1 hypothetical protein BESB_050590 [Besnoitia besnoiti]